jgi:thiol-disulfide isomerase/thioredoxin
MLRIAIRVVVLLAIVAVPAALAAEESRFFELYDIQGKLYSLERIAKEDGVRLIAVDFFWDGCQPCKKALPKWAGLHEKYKDKGLRIVIVDVRAGDDLPTAKRKLKEYFKAHPVPFPVVFDKYNLVARQFGVVGADNSVSLPQVFLLDPTGKLLLKTEKCSEAGELVEKKLK